MKEQKTEQTVLVETLEHACKLRGYNVEDITLDLSKYPEHLRDSLQGVAELLVIIDAQNEGHEFDYDNPRELKHFPLYDLQKDKNNPGGFRFGGSDFDGVVTGLSGGSSFVLRSEEESDHIGKTFAPLYKRIFRKK